MSPHSESLQDKLEQLNKIFSEKIGYDDLLGILKNNFEENKIEVYLAEKYEDAKKFILDATADKKSYIYDYNEVWALGTKRSVEVSKKNFADLDVSVVPASFLLADSGTIVLFEDYLLESLITIPKEVIFVSGVERILPSITKHLDAIYTLWRRILYDHNISFVSAPSRTGDIEKKIVMGAHGPARTTVLILDWYRDLLDGPLGDIAWKPHLRFLPYLLRDVEAKIREVGGTLSIFDYGLRAKIFGADKNVISLLKEHYSSLLPSVTSIIDSIGELA